MLRRCQFVIAALFFILMGARNLYSTFNPAPSDAQRIADITHNPVASALGSLAAALVGALLCYFISGIALRRMGFGRARSENDR